VTGGQRVLTEQGHEADADGEQRAEAEAHVLAVHGQRRLAPLAPVAVGTVARVLAGRVGHARPPVARVGGAQRVHARLPGAVEPDHVTHGAPGGEEGGREGGRTRGGW